MTEQETIANKWRAALERKYKRGAEIIQMMKELDRRDGREAVEYAIW